MPFTLHQFLSSLLLLLLVHYPSNDFLLSQSFHCESPYLPIYYLPTYLGTYVGVGTVHA